MYALWVAVLESVLDSLQLSWLRGVGRTHTTLRSQAGLALRVSDIVGVRSCPDLAQKPEGFT